MKLAVFDELLVSISGHQDIVRLLKEGRHYDRLFLKASGLTPNQFRERHKIELDDALADVINDPLIEDEAGEGPQ